MSKKVALVTGGTGGIGTAVCKELHDQGHTVVACYLPQEEQQAYQWQKTMADQGYQLNIEPCDVACYESSGKLVESVNEKYGTVGILVNAAGITRDKTLHKMEPEQWKSVLTTNLDSIFNVTKHVIEQMTENGFGRIVSISSVNGRKGQFGQTNYSAAKAGMYGFSKALAQEVARKGVTVNTVSPGFIKTSMTDEIPEDIRNSIVSQIPIGRMGEPSDIAKAIGFLCSESAAYITGANLDVNGGVHMC